MIESVHFHRGYALRLRKSKSLISYGIISESHSVTTVHQSILAVTFYVSLTLHRYMIAVRIYKSISCKTIVEKACM